MIDVRDLTKLFGDGPTTVRAVDHLSFHVGPGEVYGLLGPNGAGKTTTLRMLLGLLRPTSGDAFVDGFSASQQPVEVKRRLGLVSASAGLYQWLTPRETLAYSADLYSLRPADVAARTDRLASVLDLGGFLDRRCATLSTGQKQRVNLARALVHDPPIMLLDEPTRGLDVVGSRVIFDYIDLLRREGKAVIVSTHRLDEAERLCDRFGLLHRGQLRHEGTLEELAAQTGHARLTEMFFSLLDEGRGMVVSSQSPVS
ncbi:MAG: ATP-binding cassette domain-containing protein [Planctomycetaceae bacterium]|nr:ATP-binding cassette domain-containing protein [Planctomycetaceae bacterium]